MMSRSSPVRDGTSNDAGHAVMVLAQDHLPCVEPSSSWPKAKSMASDSRRGWSDQQTLQIRETIQD